MSDEGIRAYVASILNNTDLVINAGAHDGVEEGMKFAVLSDVGQQIPDPITGKILDSIQVAKTLVKIIHVKPNVAVGRTFRSRTSLGIFGGFAQDRTTHETLAIEGSTVQQELDPAKAKVKVGDAAIEYTGDYDGIVYDF